MADLDRLYKMFGVCSACSDVELKHAWRRTVMQNHPDRNPHGRAHATSRTQELLAAYEELRRHRGFAGAYGGNDLHGSEKNEPFAEVYVASVSPLESWIRTEEIALRKTAFREAWERYQKNPSDIIHALELICAAFPAERRDVVTKLLGDPILIDSAPLLLELADSKTASETLGVWADFLEHQGRTVEGIAMLEDAFATGKATEVLKRHLRNLHYTWAQDRDPNTGIKPAPQVRLEHLERLRELGYEQDLVLDKYMAEAYHDLGDDAKARELLRRAYSRGTGDVWVSRRFLQALGMEEMLPPKGAQAKPASQVKYRRPDQLPTVKQIRAWGATRDWESILRFTNPSDFAPRLLPKARRVLEAAALALRDCPLPDALEAALRLIHFDRYRDVREAGIQLAAKLGDATTLDALRALPTPEWWGQKVTLSNWILYLEVRLDQQLSGRHLGSPEHILSEAKGAYEASAYGKALYLLECLFTALPTDHALYMDAVVWFARAWAAMDDEERAIGMISPILGGLRRTSGWCEIGVDLSWWLPQVQSDDPKADFNYDPYFDARFEDCVVFILDSHLETALRSPVLKDAFKSLLSLMGLLRSCDRRETADWVEATIRYEAPGVLFGPGRPFPSSMPDDPGEDVLHVPSGQASKKVRQRLDFIEDCLRAELVHRLKQLVKSQEEIAVHPPRLPKRSE